MLNDNRIPQARIYVCNPNATSLDFHEALIKKLDQLEALSAVTVNGNQIRDEVMNNYFYLAKEITDECKYLIDQLHANLFNQLKEKQATAA